MSDYTPMIEAMRGADGKIDLDLANCAFTAEFAEAVSTSEEFVRSGGFKPTRLMDQPKFRKQLQRAVANGTAIPRSSSYIALDQIFGTHDAVEYVNLSGQIFNVEATLVPQHIGATSEIEADAIFKKLMRRFVEKCRRWKLNPIYIAVAENSPENGIHYHIMIAIPVEMKFQFKRWIASTITTVGLSVENGLALKIKFRTKATVENQWSWWRYLMKGMSPGYLLTNPEWKEKRPLYEALSVKQRFTGLLTVRRVRISEHISFAQRERAGFDAGKPFLLQDLSTFCSDWAYRQGEEDRRNQAQSRIKSL